MYTKGCAGGRPGRQVALTVGADQHAAPPAGASVRPRSPCHSPPDPTNPPAKQPAASALVDLTDDAPALCLPTSNHTAAPLPARHKQVALEAAVEALHASGSSRDPVLPRDVQEANGGRAALRASTPLQPPTRSQAADGALAARQAGQQSKMVNAAAEAVAPFKPLAHLLPAAMGASKAAPDPRCHEGRGAGSGSGSAGHRAVVEEAAEPRSAALGAAQTPSLCLEAC